MKRLIVFDLDGTLAESKSSLDTEMSKLLHNLFDIARWRSFPEAIGRSLKNNCFPIFPTTNVWKISPCCQPAEQSSTGTARIGKSSIPKISLQMKKRKLLVP